MFEVFRSFQYADITITLFNVGRHIALSVPTYSVGVGVGGRVPVTLMCGVATIFWCPWKDIVLDNWFEGREEVEGE